MKIQLWCDDLMTRMRLESAWKAAGATLLKKSANEVPDCIVIDLGLRDACGRIGVLREAHPEVNIIAFGPHFDAESFAAAKAAGATEIAARSSIVERVTRRLKK